MTLALWLAAPSLHAQWQPMGVFNAKFLSWVGLASTKPITEDYVPVLPWLAVMWWGMAQGQWLVRRDIPLVLPAAALAVTRPLAWLGRWSLTWYVLHQPVLIGFLMLVATLK